MTEFKKINIKINHIRTKFNFTQILNHFHLKYDEDWKNRRVTGRIIKLLTLIPANEIKNAINLNIGENEFKLSKFERDILKKYIIADLDYVNIEILNVLDLLLIKVIVSKRNKIPKKTKKKKRFKE